MKSPSFGRLAESLKFELQHLLTGSIAPEITGSDATGLNFKLSDYRGQVVLLMFSADWCAPCKSMYPHIRRLQSEFAARGFVVLSVMGDHSIDSINRSVERGDITWRTWFDGDNGPIATKWNVTHWPTCYLLDHRGTIVSRRPGTTFENLKQCIEPWLVAQEKDEQLQNPGASRPSTGTPPGGKTAVKVSPRDRTKLSFEIRCGIDEITAIAVDAKEQMLVVGGHRAAENLSQEDKAKQWRQGKARGGVEFWDARSHNKLRELDGSFGAVLAIALSPNSRFLVTAGRELDHSSRGNLSLWETESGKLFRTIGDQPQWVLGAAFSPDGSLLASGSRDRSPRIWRIPSGEEVTTIPKQPAYVDHLLFTPDGRQLIIPSRKGHVTVWDTDTWKLRQEFKTEGLFLLGAALAPDGRALAVAGDLQRTDGKRPERAGRVIVWDLQSAKVLREFKLADLVSDVSFSPDGELLAATGTNEDLTIWNWRTGDVRAFIPEDRRTSANNVMFLPKSGRLVTSATGDLLKCFELH